MTTEEIKKLKEDPQVLFFYRLPNSKYEDGYLYVIVTKYNKSYESSNVLCYESTTWMNMIIQGSPLTTACFDLFKRHRFKEYLRIPKNVNIRDIRQYCSLLPYNYKGHLELFYAYQIITEGKVNRFDPFIKEQMTIEKIVEECKKYHEYVGWNNEPSW